MKNPEQIESRSFLKNITFLAIGALAALAITEIDWEAIGASIVDDPWNINH